MKVLVTGGAGYIGSHTVKLLGEQDHEILVVDNLSTGHKQSVLHGKLIVLDLKDEERLTEVLKEFKPDVVIHFAAYINVLESVQRPDVYYVNNFCSTVALLKSMVKAGIKKIIFSSSASVYGIPETVPIPESHPLNPINPYGRSKVFCEYLLREFEVAYGINYVSLRYFNAAGADPEGRIGESHNPETHLIPLILKAAKGERKSVEIFGTNYSTPDGTCIRDFIHVNDLAEAHRLALLYLADGGNSCVLNCGYGRGYSVKEVIDTVKKVTGKDFKVEEKEKRPGDPDVLVADSSKIRQVLNWQPKFDDLEYIVKTAWNWEINRRY